MPRGAGATAADMAQKRAREESKSAASCGWAALCATRIAREERMRGSGELYACAQRALYARRRVWRTRMHARSGTARRKARSAGACAARGRWWCGWWSWRQRRERRRARLCLCGLMRVRKGRSRGEAAAGRSVGGRGQGEI
jgi:hypothetical protein